MQTCKICLVSQPLSEFHKGKGYANGHIKVCKTCRAQANADNRETMKAYNASYRLNNAARIKAQRDRHPTQKKQRLARIVTTKPTKKKS